MSETTVPTVPASGNAPVAAKTKKPRGIVNQRQAQALTKAETVAQAAQQPDNATALATRDIAPDFTAALLADVTVARNKVAATIATGTARKNATAAEKAAATALLAGLQEVQKAAKQKYSRTNRITLGDYFVGKKLNGNRPNLLQTSQAILDKVADDPLPGFSATKVATLGDLRQTWVDANTEQTTETTAALSLRAELNSLLKSIEDRRIAIQLAADAEWPHTDPANHGIRKEFALAPKRPMKA